MFTPKFLLCSGIMISLLGFEAHGFSGFYAGGNLGLNWLRGNHHFGFNGAVDHQRLSKFSPLLGLHGGYNYEFDASKTTIGIDLNINFMFSGVKRPLNQGGTSAGTVTIKQKNAFNIGAVLGKLINPKVFVYTKLGLDYSGFSYRYTSALLQNGAVSAQKNKASPLLGLGFKYAFTPSFIMGGEYNYLGLYKKVLPINGSFGGNSIFTSYKPTSHRFYITASYRFGA